MELQRSYYDIPMTSDPESDYLNERGKPMPSLNHATIQINLGSELRNRYKHQYRIVSELSLLLTDWPCVPDLAILPKMPLDLRRDIGALSDAPLCTIEIISPTQSLTELTDKAELYFQHGVRSCWLVLLPLGNVCVFSAPGEYRIFQAKDILQDEILGIEIPLQEVFEV